MLSRGSGQRACVMNAFASYLRHLIVTAILLAVEKLKLPIEGADAAADVIALTLVGTLSWWFVKYVAPKIKTANIPLILLGLFWAGLAVFGLTSCGASFSIAAPLPDKLGGGTGTITIIPAK